MLFAFGLFAGLTIATVLGLAAVTMWNGRTERLARVARFPHELRDEDGYLIARANEAPEFAGQIESMLQQYARAMVADHRATAAQMDVLFAEGLCFEFVHTPDPDRQYFKDHYGREVYSNNDGIAVVRVAYAEGDAVEDTDLLHEVHHLILLRKEDDPDHYHDHRSWQTVTRVYGDRLHRGEGVKYTSPAKYADPGLRCLTSP